MLVRVLVVVSLSAVLSMSASLRAGATAQRTFVASTGSDSNPCGLALPCRGFARAISQTTLGGEVIVLDSAGYGVVTISQSVSIIAPAGIYAGITAFSGNAVTVDAPGATVVLRGLTIEGQGGSNGILMVQPGRLRVEGCVISGMSAVGIYHQASGGEIIVVDTIVRDNRDGIGLVAANGSITLDHVRSEGNQNTGFYMAGAASGGKVTASIVDSTFSFNHTHGIWVDTLAGSTSSANVERSVMSHNAGDGFLATSAASGSKAHVILSHNAVDHNGGDGILMDGEAAGFAQGTFSENSVLENGGSGLYAAGANTSLIVSASMLQNNGGLDANCVAGSLFYTFGNVGYFSSIASSCLFHGSGH